MEILYQDKWLVVINKEPGELVQSDKAGDTPEADILKGLHVINRLDRPVSGIVLYGKNAAAAARFSELFRNRDCKKGYLAITAQEPKPSEGTLEHYLKSDTKNNKTQICDKLVKGAQKAVLHYRISGKTERYYFIEIDLETGRHHQIRAQLASIGCPVKGDLKYGYPRSNKGGGISLHARKLEFIHPFTHKQILLTAPFFSGETLWQYYPQEEQTD